MGTTNALLKKRPAKKQDKEVKKLWVRYKKCMTEKLRNELMVRFLHLVKYNAERIHTKLPDEVDVEDLMSAGIFGLMDAIDAYDLGRGVKFETYCAPRIRGAILDELRAMGRLATDEEIASRLNLSGEEFDKIRKDAGAVGVVSLNRKWYETDSNKDVREIDVLEDPKQVDPLSAVQRRDLKDLITKGLSRAERLIVILYYYEQMTMKEIGVTLDLSESRVSQMHSSILARLKAQLNHRSKDLHADMA